MNSTKDEQTCILIISHREREDGEQLISNPQYSPMHLRKRNLDEMTAIPGPKGRNTSGKA